MLSPFKEINLKNLKFIIKFLWETSPRWNVINGIVIILQSFIPLIIIYQIKLVFDRVSHSINNDINLLVHSDILLPLGSIISLSVFNYILNSAERIIKEKHNHIILESILNELHKKSIEIDLEHYENSEYYNTFHRVQTDTQNRLLNLSNQFQLVFRSFTSLSALISVLIFLHWITAIVLLVSIIPGTLIRFKHSSQLYRWYQEKTPAQRKSYYYNWLLTGSSFAKELRTFDLGETFKKKSKLLRKELFNEKYTILKSNILLETCSKIIETLAVYGVFLFLIFRSLNGYLTLGDLVMYYQVFNRGQDNIRSLLNGITFIYEDCLFLKNLIRFLNINTIVKEPVTPKPFPKIINTIKLRDICFKYPNQDKLVLRNINISMNAGEKIAIVGKNGSGKTSLIKLLCRLYNPTNGNISINNIDFCNFNIKDLRKNISVLFQDYVSYQIKASENIWLGDTSLSVNDEKIKEAAQYSGADSFIQKLPYQYETLLGKQFENGEELSIGQWQKIALARTLLPDAPIIILDEPSSSMDAQAERQVFEQISELTQDKILILISHRLSTIKSATCIYFLEDGEIVENGSHEELMNLNGRYAELFNIQSYQYSMSGPKYSVND